MADVMPVSGQECGAKHRSTKSPLYSWAEQSSYANKLNVNNNMSMCFVVLIITMTIISYTYIYIYIYIRGSQRQPQVCTRTRRVTSMSEFKGSAVQFAICMCFESSLLETRLLRTRFRTRG